MDTMLQTLRDEVWSEQSLDAIDSFNADLYFQSIMQEVYETAKCMVEPEGDLDAIINRIYSRKNPMASISFFFFRVDRKLSKLSGLYTKTLHKLYARIMRIHWVQIHTRSDVIKASDLLKLPYETFIDVMYRVVLKRKASHTEKRKGVQLLLWDVCGKPIMLAETIASQKTTAPTHVFIGVQRRVRLYQLKEALYASPLLGLVLCAVRTVRKTSARSRYLLEGQIYTENKLQELQAAYDSLVMATEEETEQGRLP